MAIAYPPDPREEPHVTEIERIRKMAADGTITQEEAAELIAVIEDIDRTEAEVGAVGAAADEAGRGEGVPASASSNPQDRGSQPPDLSRARVDAAQPTRTPAQADLATPADVRWLTIDTLAGDIEVDVDASLDAPEADGPDGMRLEAVDDDWVLSIERDGFLERLLNARMDADLRIRIPAGMGVDLQVKAGDIDLRGVPFLRGHVLAGDVSASGLRGIDFTLSAGDLDLELAADEGDNRISMKAGDLRVNLDPASDVSIEGHVSIGDANIPEGFQVQSKGLGKTYSGTLGDGTAQLHIRQSTGDTKVSVNS